MKLHKNYLYFISIYSAVFSMQLLAKQDQQKCATNLIGKDSMQYDKKEISIDLNCKKFTIHFKYDGQLPKTAMGHNVVVTKKKDMTAVGTAALIRGPENEYLPAETDLRVVAASTKLLGGGPNDTKTDDIEIITSKLEAKENYSFFCTFPGHIAIMQGDFKLIAAIKKSSAATTKKQ